MRLVTREVYEKLKDVINNLSYHYYTLDNPISTDDEWDDLYAELLEIEKEHPTWVTLDSPSQRVGGDILEGFVKAPHTIPLLSLKKAPNYELIEEFFEQVKNKVVKRFSVSLELKFDGLSIVLRYENGYLVQARTRGRDGYGEDVTAQIQTIRSIPMRIPYRNLVEVQGEVIMPLSQLEELNIEQQRQFDEAIALIRKSGREPEEWEFEKLQKQFAPYNVRNVAAGSVRQLDPKVTASRKLDAYFYNVVIAEGKRFDTQEGMMKFIKEQGFKVNDYFYILDTYEQVYEKLEEMKDKRDKLNFAIDGMVIKVNEIELRSDIGFTAKHPNFAIAFKFVAQERKTKLRGIEIDVGRTGQISFVGIVEPVDFNGTKVSRVTLNNMGDIMRKGILIGADIFIKMSGDVIPQLISVVPGATGEKYTAPKTCPSCGHSLIEKKDMLYCVNDKSCKAQIIQKFSHFTKREAMNIEGLGEKTLEQFWDNGLITTLSDLYFLTKEELLLLERFEERKAENILKSIERSKERPVKAFLYSLGIPKVGKSVSGILIDKYGSIGDLQKTGIEQLLKIDGVRGVIANNIIEYFLSGEVQRELAIFKEIGIQMEYKEMPVSGTKFKGKSFVITGTLSKHRDYYKDYIEQNGGEVKSSISKKVNFLLVGEDAGSKREKAGKLGVPIISEDELMLM